MALLKIVAAIIFIVIPGFHLQRNFNNYPLLTICSLIVGIGVIFFTFYPNIYFKTLGEIENKSSSIQSTDAPPATLPVISSPTPEKYPSVHGLWKGQWSSPKGWLYYFTMNLHQTNQDLKGSIEWTLITPPTDIRYKGYEKKVGLKSIEYVKGTYDDDFGTVFFHGTHKDDPDSVIGLDKYDLRISLNGKLLSGKSYNLGDWLGVFEGQRKIDP